MIIDFYFLARKAITHFTIKLKLHHASNIIILLLRIIIFNAFHLCML